MEEQELNINEIVKIEKMAVIKQQLDKVESFIDEKVKDIPKVLKQLEEMTDKEQEEKKGEIKKYKQYLSKIQNQLEDKRKEIHNEIEKPYNEFNEYYSNGVKIKLQSGINQLEETINKIEEQQKKEKENELREFFKQHCINKGIDGWFSFESFNYPITLSASMKSLKEEVLQDLESVEQALKLIKLEEFGDEILLEYKQNRDFSKSKLDVITRHKRLEEIKQQQEEKLEQEKQEEKVVEKVDEITIPKEVIEENELLKVTFTIETTKQNIIELKKWLNERGINYE